MNWPRRAVIHAIKRYQALGGGRRFFAVDCNFNPTCSEYTKQAVSELGVWRGARVGWQRIRRCSVGDLTQKIEDPYQSIYGGDTNGFV
ncbi:MAG: putative component of membrane protein insertase Oxa1/YidC/SpoIIIJ protein YidD [Limisphaerales bacterium]|jgi:putative component of membrane protein insertase Oxa1/YidC/SpoIIIJ protein YidD